ncbi:SHOCT domain-containing protein [Arhodomonas aquaeolei]|nr:SHOCT domain-containing protein [Arhodomonas aquaeolei]
MMWDGMGWHMNASGWEWFLPGAIHMVLFWGVLIAAAVLLVKALSDVTAGRRRGSSVAHTILAERYAKGEIDEEEYQRRLSHLKRSIH